jgi:hypothetical protein
MSAHTHTEGESGEAAASRVRAVHCDVLPQKDVGGPCMKAVAHLCLYLQTNEAPAAALLLHVGSFILFYHGHTISALILSAHGKTVNIHTYIHIHTEEL